MKILLHMVLFVIVFKNGCQASDGFGYEVLIEKMEYLDQKMEKLQNETIRQEEQRYRENNKMLQVVKDLNEQLIKLQNKTAQQEERQQREIYEQNSKMLQIMNIIYQRIEPISSCAQVDASGPYKLKVSNETFKVYCEQKLYGGGWIVIQNRFDGSVDFYRNWTEYRNGFGHLDGEFWLGLQKIYQLTSSRNFELLVHLEDFEGVVKHARYQRFAIGSENEQYVLKTLEAYSGTAGDSLSYSKNHKFSTYDQDHDTGGDDCAKNRHGAWWYRGCTYTNLNGLHQNKDSNKGMHWNRFRGYQGLKISKMMIREA